MTPESFSLSQKRKLETWQKILVGFLLALLAIILLLGIIRIAYRGRLLPGTKVYGVYVGGLTKAEAVTLLNKQTGEYVDSSTIIVNGDKVQPLSIPASEVELTYDTQTAVDQLYTLGRDGQILSSLIDEAKLIVGLQPLPEGPVSYNPAKLYATIAPAYTPLNTPSKNATFSVSKTQQLVITPEQSGQRVDLAQFTDDYDSIVRNLKRSAVTLQTKPQPAAITTAALEAKQAALAPFVEQPLTLTYNSRSWKIPTSEIVNWLSYASLRGPQRVDLLTNYYQSLAGNRVETIGFDTARVTTYLNTLAKDINQPAKDAKLTISGDRATVFQQSQDGRAIDTVATTKAIMDNFSTDKPVATLPITVNVTKADVNDANLDRLGIKELLSEGVTYFPGSSANRLVNVRVGASKFNGVLLKPGEVFSFGALLGEVGPAQGYKEGHVILEGRQENQYGGGLCQVSSTAFRAALLAGLPILERYNHAFAISFYTAPYGVPGVDATIYYPQVDFKFRNDTDNYILIQTEMVGTTLKFRYYGTKKKEGVLRGPTFISGSSDPNQPSKTVFYRDIKVNGQVTKTDTFYTTYRSALDYPSAD